MQTLLKIAGLLFLTALTFFYRLFVVQKVWGYVAVKMFHLPAITMWQIYAIMILITIFNDDLTTKKTTDKEKKKELKDRARELIEVNAVISLVWVYAYLLFG